MLKCVMRVVGFFLFPPRLASLDRIASDQTHLRFWSLINEGCYREGRFLRPLWRSLPRFAVYRSIAVPGFIFRMVTDSWSTAQSQHARRAKTATQTSTRGLFYRILAAVLEDPGLLPDDYLVYGMYRPEKFDFGKHAARDHVTNFVLDLVSLGTAANAGQQRFSQVVEDKKRFHDFLRASGLPSAPMIVTFDKDVLWEQEERLPKQDLFLKPLRGCLSQGATTVGYDSGKNRYVVHEPSVPFPNREIKYPTGYLSHDELLEALTQLGNKKGLILQPKLRCHRDISRLTGSAQLATCRIDTVKTIGSRAELLVPT